MHPFNVPPAIVLRVCAVILLAVDHAKRARCPMELKLMEHALLLQTDSQEGKNVRVMDQLVVAFAVEILAALIQPPFAVRRAARMEMLLKLQTVLWENVLDLNTSIVDGTNVGKLLATHSA